MRPGVDVEITREPVGVVGADHAVELPDRDSRVEDRAGARLRQLRRLQAGRAGARLRRGRWPTSLRARRHCRAACSTWSWAAAAIVGDTLVDDPRVDAISFTGSVDDRASASRAAAVDAWRKLQLEMGGKNPLVVLDDADLDVAVNARCKAPTSRPASAARPRQPPHRHRRHPRSLRRGDDRKHEDAVKSTTRSSPAPTSARSSTSAQLEQDLRVHRRRAEGRRAARVGGERLKRATRRAITCAPALFTDTHAGHAHQPRGDLRTGRLRHPRARTTTRRSRSPTTRRSVCPPASAPRRSSTPRTSSATRRPAW